MKIQVQQFTVDCRSLATDTPNPYFISQWSRKMFDIGGAEFFSAIYTCIHYVCTCLFFFYVCNVKAQQKFLKLKFVLEPKNVIQKWLECG